MERMKLTIDGINATLRFSLPDGRTVLRQFHTFNHAIYEQVGAVDQQVCERLSPTGHTLRASRDMLARVLRKHYRLMRYDMYKAWNAAWLEHGYDARDYNPAG